jgi:hypothetical protein
MIVSSSSTQFGLVLFKAEYYVREVYTYICVHDGTSGGDNGAETIEIQEKSCSGLIPVSKWSRAQGLWGPTPG